MKTKTLFAKRRISFFSGPFTQLKDEPRYFVRTAIFFSIVYCLLSITNCFSQGEANWWYFGANAGLDFSGGAPIAVTNGQLIFDEECGSISDAAGNLLFYTDGIQVFNSSHVQMPNGFGLLGHLSSTQLVIIQKPGSSTIYYIFTADYDANPNGIRYTEIDMMLNAGMGDVTVNKNILLNTPSCEKITGIRHCNNTDVWVITHDWNSNAFRTYLVTSAGVNSIPIISNAGLAANGNISNTHGFLKGSPDGTKLASAIQNLNRFELFDFDNSTGIVSNAILFPPFPTYAYGVEFSSDGTKMYGTTLVPPSIYQFDLCAGSNTAIANSGIIIGTSSASIGALQLAPDKKIYVARPSYTLTWVGVINSPNTLGVGCDYVDNGVSLAGKNGRLGLPNFVSYYFKRSPPPFTVSDTCLTVTFSTPNCTGSNNSIISMLWNFGDPASGVNNTSTINNPTHAFTNTGTYTVTLVLNYACGNDTITQNVTVISCGITATATSTNILCNGQCTGTGTAISAGGASPYTYAWSPAATGQTTQVISGLCAGTYSVLVTDGAGSTVTATVTITQPATALTATATATDAICGGNNGNATATAGGGTPGYSYSWNNSQTSQTATGLAAGNYTVTVIDANSCNTTQTVTVVSTGSVNTMSQSATICTGSTYTLPGGSVVSTSGIYSDTLTSVGGCDSIMTTTLTVNPNPTANAASNTTITQGQSVTLTASGGETYSWNNGANGSSITVTPLVTTVYCVTVTDVNNCTDTACVTVTIEPIDCSNAGELYLPNAFSPNGDGENDKLLIYYGNIKCIKTFKFVIYNRWGEKVFTTYDSSAQWDGSYRGKMECTAVFVYYLKATLISGEEIVRKGNISLIK